MARWSPSSALRLYRTSAQRRQLHGTRNPPGNLGDPADVNSEMAIAREEQFGPIVCLMRFDTEDQALAMVNDTPARAQRRGCIPVTSSVASPFALVQKIDSGGDSPSRRGRPRRRPDTSHYLVVEVDWVGCCHPDRLCLTTAC
jgi:hypothetical protein